jgi:phosphomethylpyrimidine synthase
MREIMQSNGEAIVVYDTSGPYTDPQATIDVRQGLAPGADSPSTDEQPPLKTLILQF